MQIWKLYKHDLDEGICMRAVYLLLPVLIALFSCIGMHYKLVQLIHLSSSMGSGTVLDYWLYFIEGGKQYTFSVYNFFSMPVRWISFYALFMVCVNNYPLNDLKKLGIQIIIRSKSRKHWWISKLLWIATYAILYTAISFAVVALYAYSYNAQMSLKVSVSMVNAFTRKGFLLCGIRRLVCISFVQPILLLILFGCLQMALSMKFPAINTFILLFACLVISSYKRNWLLFGNWGMPYRMFPVAAHGLEPQICLILLTAAIGVAAAAGYLIYNKRDILEEK